MNCILFDDPVIRTSLLPFTFTRPVSSIRVGIVTIAEKWQHFLQMPVSVLTEPYLQQKFPQQTNHNDEVLYINGAICPDELLLAEILKLKTGERLEQDTILIAFKPDQPFKDPDALKRAAEASACHVYPAAFFIVRQLYDIFVLNGVQIKADFTWLTKGRESAPITDPHTKVYNPEWIFVEDGAVTLAAVLNAQSGPIYIGKNAQIQEGCVVRGAFVLGEDSILNMGSKMRGDITIGPYCKVGGEISNSIIFGYSNKSHDGFMGNSVVGEWCNIGADTNTSNMKNDYGNVKLWNYAENNLVDTGRQFCGLMMGDHSKAGINTMFNTGSVVGVSANIFGGDFPPKYVPSFAWGGAKGFEVYQLDKALQVAERAMQRRNCTLTEVDKEILTTIFNQTHKPEKRIGFV